MEKFFIYSIILVCLSCNENKDWNVYKLEKANTSISFVEQTPDAVTSYLYTDYSLFNYVDSNQLQENDLSRYLCTKSRVLSLRYKRSKTEGCQRNGKYKSKILGGKG